MAVMAIIRVGIQLPEVEREIGWPEYVTMARAAEDSGFDSIWVGDHYLYRGDGRPERGPWEAWTLLAALAAVTSRVRLGPLVACLAFHEPAVLAKMAATVDEISGGRLVFGVGAGWNESEFRAYGIPYDHRVARFEESYGIVRPLLDGERVTFHGTYAHVEEAVLLPRPTRRPPLMVGSSSRRMLAATLPTADAWNTWFDEYGNSVEGYARLRDRIDDACVAAGRDPADVERSVCVLVAVDGGADERPVPSGMRAIEGSASALGDQMRGLADLGVGELIIVADPIDERSIRTLGETVRSIGA
jgi:probable F420-dependent oxidoreductase